MILEEATHKAIAEQAKLCYPNECCGYVVRNAAGVEELYVCQNTHDHPKEHFRITDADTQCALGMGEIICVYHSHPDASADPSPLDKACCFAMDLPWIITSHPSGDWYVLLPEEHQLPYEGREFFWGVQDCYTLLRDWYRKEKGIILTDYPREDSFWLKGQDLYLDNFEKEGFVRLADTETAQIGDVFLHKLKSKEIPNHASIYQGNGQILHHVFGLLSIVEPLTGLWAKTIHSRYRHKNL